MSNPLREIEFDGPRQAQEHELVQAVQLADVVLNNSNQDHGRNWAHVYRTSNLSNVCVAKHAGRVVHACAVFYHNVAASGGRVRVAGLSGVCTHPDYRRYGLGSRAMLYCLDQMRAHGAHLGLLGTGIPDWYRKFGWERAGARDSYLFDRGNIALLPAPGRYSVRTAGPGDQADVLDLLNAQPGGGRAPDVDGILLDIRQPATLLAEHDGRLAAFMRIERRQGAEAPRAVEHAGEAEAAATLIRSAFERSDDPAVSTTDRDAHNHPVLNANLTVIAPAWGSPLGRYLEGLGIPRSRGYLGMVRVVDPAGLLEALGRAELLESTDGETTTLRYRGERATFDARELAKALLGPERTWPLAADALPAPFHVWPYDRV